MSATTGSTTYYYAYSWGSGGDGMLGLNNTANYSSPTQVGSANVTWSKLVHKGAAVIAIKTNGTLWGWGDNTGGGLGLNNLTNYSSPKQVGALTNWASITGSQQVSIAIKTNGSMWSWGSNSFSQLGGGSSRSSPAQIGTDTNWLSVVCGGYFQAFAIRTTGTLWAWGYDNTTLGRGYLLGLNNTVNYSFNSPNQIGADTNWAAIFTQGAQSKNSFAVKTTGTLWGWGVNANGELGVGDTSGRRSPVQVGTLTTWLSGATSGIQTAAIKTDSSLWTWGAGTSGILGLNNTTNYSSPKQVGGYDWLKVVGGGYHFIAQKTAGSIWGWGSNSSGQLGDNTTTTRSSPVQIGSSTHWGTISAKSSTGHAF